MKVLLASFILTGLIVLGLTYPGIQYLFWGGAVVSGASVVYLKYVEVA